MVTKMNPNTNGSRTPSTDDLRDIIPAFPEPQTFPKGWDVSGIMPSAVPLNSVSKTKQTRP